MKFISTVRWHSPDAPALPRSLQWCLADGCRVSQPLERQHTGYDLLLEQEGDSPRVLDVLYRQFADQATLASYLVEECVEKDSPALAAGTGPHGRKLVTCWRARADLTSAQARQRWDEHAPLAKRIHVGCQRYVRNWVQALVRASGDFPPIYAGIAFQYFASARDLAERLFDTPDNTGVIQRDVEAFIAAFEVQVCTDWLHGATQAPGGNGG